jgi:uncharacterized membrane protein
MQEKAVNRIIGIFLLLVLGTTQAAPISDLDVGDDVYVQGVFSDDLVYIVRIDYQNQRVKVRRGTDGTTTWVNPSRLISRETSVGNDVGRVAVVIALAVCAFDPDACSSNSRQTQQRATTPPSGSSTGFKFHVANECKHSVRLALRYLQPNGKWTTAGWWTFSPNSSRFLKFNNGTYARTNNTAAYYYAEATNQSLVWTGDHSARLDDRSLAMRKVTDTSGDTELRLTCNA